MLQTQTSQEFESAVARASDLLRAGQVVALPTETVYGLAANAFDPVAVAKLFEVKGRPSSNPIIVHVSSLDMARQCVAAWPDLAGRLARAFWPGPLTLVLPRSPLIPDIVTAGGGTVGIRWPRHPLIEAVITSCGFPLAAPSANRSCETSPTTAAHVRKSLGSRVPLIIDGGPSQVGVESTVLDVTSDPPHVLRPGMVHNEALCAMIGKLNTGRPVAGTHKSPGLLRRHYAPRATLVVTGWRNDAELGSVIQSRGVPPGQTHVLAHTRLPALPGLGGLCRMPLDPQAFARALYAELHRCDETGAGLILVEAPPEEPGWAAVADRLRRAAEPKTANL